MRLPVPLARLLSRLGPWLLPIAALAGMVELIGGGWDIQWHLQRIPEVFWTPPHIVLYAGAGVVLLSTGAAFLLRWTGAAPARPVRVGTAIAFAGAALQFVAGGFDNAWHAAFGADDSLSPPHVLLTAAMVVSTVGVVVALHAWRATAGERRGTWIAHAIGVTAISWASWGLLFILLFPGLTLSEEMGLVEPLGLRLFTAAAFAALTPFAVIAAVRIVRHRGAATVTAGAAAVSTFLVGGLAGAISAGDLLFLPIYVVPGIAADLLYRPRRRGAEYVALALGGVFAQYGFFPGGVVTEMTRPDLMPAGFALAFLAGGVAGVLIAQILAGTAEGLAERERAPSGLPA